MKRKDFLKNASIALAGIKLNSFTDMKVDKMEEINFIKHYINKYVDFTDTPDDLDLAERALTAYIHGELSKRAAVKILIFTDNLTEEEALKEIKELDEMRLANKKKFDDTLDDENFSNSNMKSKKENTDYSDEVNTHVPYGFGD